jgi:selenocysteine lyase/cysteine desulfurase
MSLYDVTPTHPERTADRGLLPVVGEELRVPLVGGATVRYANLDQAATAPALAAVAERVTRILPYYGSVHRGAGLPSQVSTALYESARGTVARFVGARPDDAVLFTRNTTDALNLLAHCVPATAGDVVFLDSEHHANLLPWRGRAHRSVPVADTLEETLRRLRLALSRRRTALVAVTGASNVTGELLPIDRIVAIAREAGARVVVDAAQLAPHRRFSASELGADYVVLSGHKLYAPYGAGALIGRADWLDGAAPYLAGGGAVRDVRADGVDWADGPARHEAGTPNLLGAVAIAAACAALDALDPGELEAHEAALRERTIAGLEAIDGVTLHRIWPDSEGAIGVVTFSVDGSTPEHVAAYLSAEHGIGVRDGRFCAHQLVARLGAAGGALRASFGVSSRLEDADRLVEAIAALVAQGTRWEYTTVDGALVPAADDRALPDWLGVDLGAAASAPASPCAPAAVTAARAA